MNDKLNEVDDSFNKFISDSNKGQADAKLPELKTYTSKLDDLRKQLTIERKELEDLKLANFTKQAEAKQKEINNLNELLKTTDSELLKNDLNKAKAELATIIEQGKNPIKAVSDQEAVVKGLEDQLGMHKKAVDELKVAQESLEKAIKSGNQSAINAAAKRVDALEQEKKKLEEIIDLELKRAWRSQFDGQSMSPMTSKDVAPITQIGSKKTVQGILYEVTAIDKTGAVWTKVKAEYSDLKKFEKKTNDDAAKDQEKLDKKVAEEKERTQQQILEGALQFTNELIDQLDLSEQQTKQLKETANIISSAASGNWIGAAFQAVSMVIGTLKEETVSFLDITNKQISKTNDLLELYSKILSGLSGNNYYKVSAAELKKINLELDSYNKKLADIAVSDSRTHRKIDTSNWDTTSWLNALDNPIYNINGGEEATAAILAQIADLEAKKATLIDEMYQTILGFGTSDVSDAIFQGIEDGLKLGENSLGGFSQSFGDLMKKALMQAIIDSTNSEITSDFLPKVKEFLQNDEVGPNGEKISTREQLLLEGIYSGIVKGAQEQQSATEYITDKYGTSSSSSSSSSSGLPGSISRSITEETAGELAGLWRKSSDDTRQIKDYMQIGINHLVGIEANTYNTVVELKNAVVELKSINSNTKPSITSRDWGLSS
jgi:hypothetical protein